MPGTPYLRDTWGKNSETVTMNAAYVRAVSDLTYETKVRTRKISYRALDNYTAVRLRRWLRAADIGNALHIGGRSTGAFSRVAEI
jgi:hypothetical protein